MTVARVGPKAKATVAKASSSAKATICKTASASSGVGKGKLILSGSVKQQLYNETQPRHVSPDQKKGAPDQEWVGVGTLSFYLEIQRRGSREDLAKELARHAGTPLPMTPHDDSCNPMAIRVGVPGRRYTTVWKHGGDAFLNRFLAYAYGPSCLTKCEAMIPDDVEVLDDPKRKTWWLVPVGVRFLLHKEINLLSPPDSIVKRQVKQLAKYLRGGTQPNPPRYAWPIVKPGTADECAENANMIDRLMKKRTAKDWFSTMSQSNNFFRNYAALASPKERKTDQNTVCSKPISKKQRQSTNQLFLDFGHNSFGRQLICNICGMLRVDGMEEDDAQHAKICKEYREGVSCLGWKNERRVATFKSGDRILEVRSEDAPQHRKKVLEVKTIVDREMGFVSSENEDPARAVASMTSYMYVSKKRVAGLLMVKRIQRAYELLPSEAGDGDNSNDNNDDNSSSISRSLKSSKALLGVHQIWVHNSHRSRGIASKLVTAARDHLIFGMMVPLELVAFSSPTDEGLRFAKRYTDSERPLIYDIH